MLQNKRLSSLSPFVIFSGLALFLLSCNTEVARKQNLALIVLDTVRVDHLSAYGYGRPTTPFLERFAAEGARFDRAYSTSSWTLPAHASMFTGLLPKEHGATQSSQQFSGNHPLLAALLSESGFQTAGFSNNAWVSHQRGLAKGFGHFEELWRSGRRPWQRGGHPTVEGVQWWLEKQWNRDRPFFLFVNLMEAHGPYTPPWISAAPIFKSRRKFKDTWSRYTTVGSAGMVRRHYLQNPPLEPDVISAALDLYDAEIRQVDGVAEQIIGLIDQVSEPANTTILIVTDHGQHFGEHNRMGHTFSVYDTLLRVALLARGPGFEKGRKEKALTQVTDIFATLLAIAETDPPETQQGLDLRKALFDDRGLQASYDYPLQAIQAFPEELQDDPRLDPFRRAYRAGIQGRYKLIRDTEGCEEVFDILDDPAENQPLKEIDMEVLTRLRNLAGKPVVPGKSEMESGKNAPMDEETVKALRELGYLE